MPRLKRHGGPDTHTTTSLRLRAAWLYFEHKLTQQQIAEKLGVSRATVNRMLDEAHKRSEVQIWISDAVDECVALAARLERALGLDEAIVAPGGGDAAASASVVGAALGQYLSRLDLNDLRLGVGWGRTLSASLANFRPPRTKGAEVLSLLGGVVEPGMDSPIEFCWRLAGRLEAGCYLLPAPLLVDSAETRRRLIEACGLDRVFDLAAKLDVALISVGDIGPASSSLSAKLLTRREIGELRRAGSVADIMCTFVDEHGRDVDHPIRDRVMSLGLDNVANAKNRIVACGGAHRAAAVIAAHRRIGFQTLVTDEAAATAILKRLGV